MRLLCADLLQRHPRRCIFRMGRGGKFRITVLASLGIIPKDNRNRNLLVLCLYLEKRDTASGSQPGIVRSKGGRPD